jgi:hypothetical protein
MKYQKTHKYERAQRIGVDETQYARVGNSEFGSYQQVGRRRVVVSGKFEEQ